LPQKTQQRLGQIQNECSDGEEWYYSSALSSNQVGFERLNADKDSGIGAIRVRRQKNNEKVGRQPT